MNPRDSLAIGVLVPLVVACSSSTPSTPPPADAGADAAAQVELRIDSFNVGLAGAFVPNESVRRPAIVAALPGAETDVLCLQEVWSKADKAAIIAAAKSTFPYEVHFDTDLNTPLTDGRDATGVVPSPYTTPPCTGEQATALTRGLTCLKDNCSSIPGSDDGRVTSTECAKTNCASSAAALLFATDKRCYGCFASVLPSSTIKEIGSECTTEVNGGLFDKGNNGVLILSRYPLSKPEQYVLPGTWTRRTAAKATATLPAKGSGAPPEVDVYCTHLTPYFSDTTFYPYTGQYGTGEDNPWLAEQALQASKLVSWVASQSGTRPAVIMGDFNATPEDTAHGIGDGPVSAYGAKTLQIFSVWQEALSSAYVPSCTFCVGNQNTDGDQNSWLDHIYLSGFPTGSTISTVRTFDTDVVDGMRRGPDGAHNVAGKVPLSDHYGIRATVRVPAR